MKRIKLLPNLITAFGLVCGLFIIFKMSMASCGGGCYPVMRAAAILLLLAAIADVLDGATARIMGAQSDFGALFDSLSDAITFGVAPAVIMLKGLVLQPEWRLSFLPAIAAMTFSLCGVLRLVRHNVGGAIVARGKPLRGDAAWCRTFVGLPIPGAAAAAVSASLFFSSPDFGQLLHLGEVARMLIASGVMFLLGYLMVSRWRFPALRSLQFRVRSHQLVLITIALAIFLFYGIFYYFPAVFLAIAWGYVIIAFTLSLIRLILGKRISALDAFEPQTDEEDDWEEEDEGPTK